MKNQKKQSRIEMSLGGQTLHRVKDGFKLRRKSGVDAERVHTDPKFKRTLENASDFTTGAYAGRVLREALNTVTKNVKDGNMATRLATAMRAVLKTDMENLRGQRSVLKGDLYLLDGFQFNANSSLASSILAPYTASIDRESGIAKVTIPPYKPETSIASPPGATHYVLNIAATAVDFEAEKAETVAFETSPLPLDMTATEENVLSVQLPADSDKPLFLVFGIYFVQLDNGVHYPIGGLTYNALAIVAVDNE